jgi:hypothetical protein
MYLRSTSSCCGRSNCCACEAPACVPHSPWCILLRVDSATPKILTVFLYASSSPPSRASKSSIALSIAGLIVELWVVKDGSRNVGGVRRCGVRWCAALDGEQQYRVGSADEPVQPMSHTPTLWTAHSQCCSTTHNSYYHEISRQISKQGNAKLLVYSEYLFGALIVQVPDAFCRG